MFKCKLCKRKYGSDSNKKNNGICPLCSPNMWRTKSKRRLEKIFPKPEKIKDVTKK